MGLQGQKQFQLFQEVEIEGDGPEEVSTYLSLVSLILVLPEADLKCGGAAMMIHWKCLASKWQRGRMGRRVV